MEKVLIIPDVNNIEESIELARRYNLGFEYNDFFDPDVLDDEKKIDELVELYKKHKLPSICTVHGAFYDIIPFSKDKKIKEISVLRIKQSIDIARRLGAVAVVFHTNYNPLLNSEVYKKIWLEENVKIWSRILEENTDIGIYLENMFDTSPDMMVALSEQLAGYDNYGVCLDYGHVSISKVSPEEWIRSLGRYIKHNHINDNDLISDQHLPWGEGKVNRDIFYEGYEKYMSEATVLIENTGLDKQKKSLKKLEEDGFVKVK